MISKRTARSRLRARLSIAILSTMTMVISLTWAGHPAAAQAKPHTPAAPPGPGPVHHPLPASALRNHGYPPGQRPPVVPPETAAAGKARKLAPAQWSAIRKLAADPAGATDVLARPGFALDDTSLVVYFDGDPDDWASWLVTVYDPATQAAQESKPLAPADAVTCQVPRTYCRTFGTQDGWTLADGHDYFVTVTATLADGSQVVSAPSGTAKARTTAAPPPIPAGQAAGCTCPDLLAPSAVAQAVRGSGVQTGTGGFTTSTVDLRMAGFGVPFRAARQYSSANTTAGTLGLGWSWTYDARVIPPAAGQTAVTVRAEDGAQAVYQRAGDGSYQRPPGVRSSLAATDSGWKLTTPSQVTYAFDATGRLVSIKDTRGFGTTVAYTATKWTITDAAGRKVTVALGGDGLVSAITLPDGRTVRYQYRGGQLATAADATGATWSYGYTGGLLTTLTDPQKRVQISNTYAGGRVTEQVDAGGAGTTFTWAADKQEATTIDADGVPVYDGYRGNVLVYTQNGNGDVTNARYDPGVNRNLVVDPQGNQTSGAFDAAGNLTARTAPDPFGFSATSTFDGHNNVTAHTDGEGNTSTYAYTAFDELQAVTSPGGGQDSRTFDDRGLVTSLTDARGKVTTMAYDDAGNLISQTSPMAEKTTYTYDSAGRMVTVTDPRGNQPGARPSDYTTRYVYDDLDRLRKTYEPGKREPSESVYDSVGQLTASVDPLGDAVTHDYAKVIGRTVAVTNPNGDTSRYGYTTAGRLKSESDPLGDKTTYTYDNRGNLATMVSPRGNAAGANPANFTTTYLYDSDNNLVRGQHPYPGGGFTSTDTEYDELGRATANTDALGKTTTTSYNNNSQLVSTLDPLGQRTTVVYDADGRPVAAESPAGGRHVTEFDKAGNATKRTTATGGVTTFTYNDDGALSTMVEARGNADGANPADYTTTYTYDAARNLVAVTDPLGAVTRATYDANGRTIRGTDADGHVTKYDYDDADRLVSIIGPDASDHLATTYEYDRAGRALERTDPNDHTTAYRYDAAGRLASTTDPLKRQTTFGYDAEGELTSMVAPGSGDAAARSIVLSYDILGRQVGEDMAHGGTIYAWGYDANDRVTSLADPAGLRTQTYDDNGRLTQVSRGGKQTFGYDYDADGNVTGRTWPDGTKISAQYDGADEMTGLTAQGGVAGATPATYTFGYDGAGRPTTTSGAGGLVTERSYDRAGRLVDLNSHTGAGTAARYRLTLDPVGNPTSVTTTRGTTDQTVAYTYDPANRITSAASGTGTIAWGYDPVGNRTSQTRTGSAGGDTTTYQHDAADELTSLVTKNASGTKKTEFAYDGQGNQVKAGPDTFGYNLDHTLASATVGGVQTSYTYDAEKNQLSAVTNAGGGTRSRSWAVDVNAAVPTLAVETTSTPTGSASRGVLPGPGGGPLALLTGGKADTLVPDWLGGAAGLVAPDGASLATYDFDPYGVAAAGNTSTVDNPIQFAGLYQDPTLGARYSTPARVYDPATGVFGGTDPASPSRTAPAVSGYAYVDDRPTVLVDPSGATPANGSPQAHDTAVALRVLDLEQEFNGIAQVSTAIGGVAGADLVCWNCAAWASNGKSTDIWVWEVKSVQDTAADATASLNGGIAAARQDPLAKNGAAGSFNVVPGRAFPHETGGMVAGISNQVIIVYSDPTRDPQRNGVELYEVDDTGTPLFANDPRREKTDAAVDMAALQNKRSDNDRKTRYDGAAVPDEGSSLLVAALAGILAAALVFILGELISAFILWLIGLGGGGAAGAAAAAGAEAEKVCELVGVC